MNPVNLFRLMYFDMLYQIIQHTGREFICAGVLANGRDEHIRLPACLSDGIAWQSKTYF